MQSWSLAGVGDVGDWSVLRLLGLSVDELGDDELLRGHACELVSDDASEGADARVYVDFHSAGMSFIAQLDQGVVNTIQLYAEGHEDHIQYCGPLPAGLGFESTRDLVRAQLGDTTASGEAREVHPFGLMPAWDRYELDDVTLHVQYQRDMPGISLISITGRDDPAIRDRQLRVEHSAFEPSSSTQEQLIPVFIPSLVALLAHAEKSRGRPLNEDEVTEIRDNGVCMMGSESAAIALDRSRGYSDIDPERAWEQWQAVRAEIVDEMN